MMRAVALLFVAIALSVGMAGCQKLPAKASINKDSVFLAPISTEYGDLVSVVQDPYVSHAVSLWFVKPDKSITAVYVDYQNGIVANGVLVIPRR